MKTPRTLVVPIDATTASHRSLGTARTLADQWQVPTVIVTALSSDTDAEEARRRLEKVAADFPGPVQVRVRVGPSVRSELLAELRHHPGAIGVVATHASGPVREMVLGSVANELVRHSPTPIVLVGPRVGPPPPTGYADLVACIDGSDRSLDLLDLVRAAPELNMAPAVLEVQPSGLAGKQSVADAVARLEAEGVPVDHRLVHGADPVAAIVEAVAGPTAVLAAIATEGRDPFARMTARSTAIAVVRDAQAPILVLGPSAG